jgi:hypothetical protein
MVDPTNMDLGFNRHMAKYLEAYNKMQEGEGALSQHMRSQGIIPVDADGNETTHVSDADALGHWTIIFCVYLEQRISDEVRSSDRRMGAEAHLMLPPVISK